MPSFFGKIKIEVPTEGKEVKKERKSILLGVQLIFHNELSQNYSLESSLMVKFKSPI